MQINLILKLVKPIGIILTLVSLWFLAKVFYQNYPLIIGHFYDPVFLLLFLIGVFLYSITLLIIVFAWQVQLNDKYPAIGFLKYFSVIAISQVGKYLPGNVFHLAGRFIMAKKLDIKTNHITNSILFETILVVISAAIFGFFYLNHYSSNLDFKINISLLVLIIFGVTFTFFILDSKKSIKDLLTLKKIIIILISYIFSHVLIGLIVYLFQYVLLNLSLPFMLLTSGYVLSFAVGFLTPGSPAGIGVREAIFLKLMLFELSESDALTLMISLRLISVVGDILLFGIALILKKNTEKVAEVI